MKTFPGDVLWIKEPQGNSNYPIRGIVLEVYENGLWNSTPTLAVGVMSTFNSLSGNGLNPNKLIRSIFLKPGVEKNESGWIIKKGYEHLLEPPEDIVHLLPFYLPARDKVFNKGWLKIIGEATQLGMEKIKEKEKKTLECCTEEGGLYELALYNNGVIPRWQGEFWEESLSGKLAP